MSFFVTHAAAQAQAIRPGYDENRIVTSGVGCELDFLDCSSPAVPIGFTVNFFGTNYSTLFVNSHGNVTFGRRRASGFLSDVLKVGDIPIVAAFFADNHMAATNTPVTYGAGTVDGQRALGANYLNQGYYRSHVDKTNSFQVILIDRSDTGDANFDIEFNYARITWEAGGPESPSQNGSGGLCANLPSCVPALVGWSNGLQGALNRSFQIDGSLVTGALLDVSPTGLVKQSVNSSEPGRLVFLVRGGEVLSGSITSLTPFGVVAGSGTLTVNVSGTGFVRGSTVVWDGVTLDTTFLDATQLRAIVPASLVAKPGAASLVVSTPKLPPTNSVIFRVAGPDAPTLGTLSPDTALLNSAALPLRALGINFANGAVLEWTDSSGTTVLPASFVSSSQLETTVPASRMTTTGTAQVSVVNPGRLVSNTLPFKVNVSVSAPTLALVTPNAAVAEDETPVVIRMHGEGFTNGAQLYWAGPRSSQPINLPTAFINSMQLEATLPATVLSTPGSAQLAIQNPGGLSSVVLPFTLTSAQNIPVLSSITPGTAPRGALSVVVRATGKNFATGSSIRWADRAGTLNIPVTFIDSTLVEARIPGNRLIAPGTAYIAVATGLSLVSNALPFTVTQVAGPVVDASGFVNPATLVSGLTPGGITTMLGTGLALGVQGTLGITDPARTSITQPLPTQLANLDVRLGGIPCPIFSVSNVNGRESATIQVPFELRAGPTVATVTVAGLSTTFEVSVLPLQPVILEFTDADGRRRAELEHLDGSLVTAQNPARRGEIVKVLTTGLGPLNPVGRTNQPGTGSEVVVAQVISGVNGLAARTTFANYRKNSIGVYEVGFEIPPDTVLGPSQPLSLAVAPGAGSAQLVANPSLIPIADPSVLTVSPTSMSFAYQIGSTAPAPQALRVDSSSQLSVTATPRTSTGGNWLLLSRNAGTTPFPVDVSVNAAGLPAGSYSGTIAVTAPGATSSQQAVAVTLSVSAAPVSSTLVVNPAEGLVFQHIIEGQRPSPQSLFVTSTGNPISFTASADVSSPGGPRWLDVQPRSGTKDAVLSVSVNPAGLSAGYYDGSITVVPAPSDQTSQTIPVRLSVVPRVVSKLQTDTPRLTFFSPLGGSLQKSQVRIVNPGPDLINFQVTPTTDNGGNWLSASRIAGLADSAHPATVLVSVDPTGLTAGSYSGRVVIQGSKDHLEVPVAFVVSKTPKALVLSQTALRFSAIAATDIVPPEQTVDVLASGIGSLRWTASATTTSAGNWLSITPDSEVSEVGSTQLKSVRVTAKTGSLSAGEYHGTISIESGEADNRPQQVGVVLTVLPAGRYLGPFTVPTGVTFVAPANGASPASQTVNLFYPEAKPGARFAASVLPSPDTPAPVQDWLKLDKSQGVFDARGYVATLTLKPDISGLPVGVYRATVTVVFPGNVARNISVLLAVTGAVAPNVGNAAAAACAPTEYLPLFTSLEQQFALSIGEPARTELVVIDNCGNPVVAGSVASTFSTRDRPLDLLPLGDGRWRASWVPRTGQEQGAVSLNVFATDSAQTVAEGAAPVVTGFLGGSLSGPVLQSEAPILDPNGRPQLAVAPGSMIRIRGAQLADAAVQAPGADLPVQLGSTRVTLGDHPLLLKSVAPEELVAVVPDGVPTNVSLPLVVTHGEYRSAPEATLVAQSWPVVIASQVDRSGEVLVVCSGLGDEATNTTIWIGRAAVPVNSIERTGAGIYRLRARPARGFLPGDVFELTIGSTPRHSARASTEVR